MRFPVLSLLLLAALLLRGLIAPGVMPSWEDGRYTVALCGINGGSVTLDLGPVSDSHSSEHETDAEHCVFAATASLGLVAGFAAIPWPTTRESPQAARPDLTARGPPRTRRARGPPPAL
jgi:hypothetical protein